MQNTDVEDDRQDTRNVRSALFVLSLVLPNKEWSSRYRWGNEKE